MKQIIKFKGIILFAIFVIAIMPIQEQSIKKDSSEFAAEMSQVENINK